MHVRQIVNNTHSVLIYILKGARRSLLSFIHRTTDVNRLDSQTLERTLSQRTRNTKQILHLTR